MIWTGRHLLDLLRCAGNLLILIAVTPLAACTAIDPGDVMPADVQLVPVGDPPVRLAVREAGRGAPVLMVHGLATPSYTWRHLVPRIAANHKVITVDLMGFGASDKPRDEDYTVARQAALIQALIKKKDLRNLTLIGHSYGGGVSLLVALRMAKAGDGRLRRLVLIDTLSYPQATPPFFRIVQTPVLGDISSMLVPPEWEIAAGLRLAYAKDSKVTDEVVEEYARPLRSASAKHALLETIRKIVPDNIEEISRQYPLIKVPTLVLWCEKDRVVPPEFGARLAQDLPHGRLQIIAGCGHYPQEEKPEETLRAIQAHLQQ